MIVTTDIENILFAHFEEFGIATYKKDAVPEGVVIDERIVIITNELKSGTYWNKDFVVVNFCVPSIVNNNILLADKIRLREIERLASAIDIVGVYDGTNYRCSLYSTSTEEDKELKCHYVSVKLLFEILNVK